MSERDMKKSDGYNSEDKDFDEDYYFDEIDESDDDYYLDDEPGEDDEDYFFDEEEDAADELKEQDGSSDDMAKTQVIPDVVPVKAKKKPVPVEVDIFDEEEDLDDIFPDEEEPKKKNKKPGRKKGGNKKSMKKLWIILGCIAAVLIAAYVGTSVFFMSHFYINTEINGHDFSGKKVSDVEEYLKKQVKDYSLTVHEKDNKSDTIDGTDISLTYKENNDIQKALKKQNGFAWPAALFSKNSAKVTIEVSYDEEALNQAVGSLQAVTAEQTAPKSAYPKFNGGKYVIEPEVIGTAVNMDVLKEKVHTYISEFKTDLDMEKEECYAEPKFTSDSEEVKKACDTMNKYVQASIT